MILNLENLTAGIYWWKHVQGSWGADIGNSEYGPIYNARAAGVTSSWWATTVDRLWDWKAIRSSTPPNSKLLIRERGEPKLADIAQHYAAICILASGEPTIEEVCWQHIAPMFEIGFAIKYGERRSASPVFASKMCHFIFPRVFPVVDNKATGYFDYEFYWRGMKDAWGQFADRGRARKILEIAIEAERVHELYPWETRIIELCHIGYTHYEKAEAMARERGKPLELEPSVVE